MATKIHIPAWKKLGLKLKYANDTTDVPVTSIDIGLAANGANDKKRRTSPRDEDEKSGVASFRSTKRTKTSRHVPDDSATPTPQSTAALVAPAITQESDALPESSPSPTKRKSVSFTPETKTVDGEGTKKLYTTWLVQQADDFDPTTAAQALRHVTPPQIIPAATSETALTSTASKEKKQKTSKSVKSSQPAVKEESSTTPILPTLQYLQSYHESRPTWKFNKSKQNQILKHAFNTFKIPSDYDEALKAYISGLESSAANKRLRDEAMDIRNEDKEIDQDDTVSPASITASFAEGHTSLAKSNSTADEPSISSAPADPEAEKAARHAKKAAKRAAEPLQKQHYRHALHRYEQQLRGLEFEREEREKLLDPAWRMRLLKRKRAELVLWSVGNEKEAMAATAAQMAAEGGVAALLRPGVVFTGVMEDAGAKRQNGEGPPKRKRKRKRRTGVPDDDSSSDESSSSSGTSSGGDVGGKEKIGWMNLNGEGALLTDDGSGGSSGDESGSERESEKESSSGSGSGSSGESGSENGSESGSGSGSGRGSGSDSGSDDL